MPDGALCLAGLIRRIGGAPMFNLERLHKVEKVFLRHAPNRVTVVGTGYLILDLAYIDDSLRRENEAFRREGEQVTAVAIYRRSSSRSVGSLAAVDAVCDYLAAKFLTLSQFAVQSQTTDRTIRHFLRTGKMRRANFAAMASAMGVTPDQLLKGDLPSSIPRPARG
mgnify:FL=1